MRVLRFDRTLRREIDTILHLPLWQRVFHRKTRKPMIGITAAIGIMSMGSLTAHSGHWLAEHFFGWALGWDVLGYLMHGLGSVPIIKFAEPAWAIIMGAERVAEAVVESA